MATTRRNRHVASRAKNAAKTAPEKAPKVASAPKAARTTKQQAIIDAKQVPPSKEVTAKTAAAHKAALIARYGTDKPTKAQVKAYHQKTARAQADKDVSPEAATQLVPPPMEGDRPSLHYLNQQAKMRDTSMRDEARDAANASGKAVYDVLRGNRPNTGRHGKAKRLRQAAIAAAQSAAKAG